MNRRYLLPDPGRLQARAAVRLVPAGARSIGEYYGPLTVDPEVEATTCRYLDCDGRYLLVGGERTMDRRTLIYSWLFAVSILVLLLGVVSSGQRVMMERFLVLALSSVLAWWVYRVREKIRTHSVLLFDRDTESVIFPLQQGDFLRLPFASVHLYLRHQASCDKPAEASAVLQSSLMLPGGRVLRAGIELGDGVHPQTVVQEWKFIVDYMDRGRPIAGVLQDRIRRHAATGTDVFGRVVGGRAADQACTRKKDT